MGIILNRRRVCGGKNLPEELFVDMGLPSGTLWATRNIDVTQPDGFAASPYQYECSFFSWGNTDGHNPTSNNSFSPYTWGGSMNEEPYVQSPGAQLTGNIGPSYDAARVNCGAPWRMSTVDDFQELLDNTNFVQADGETVIDASQTNKLVTVNGVTGIYLKSKINDNLLFFACTGVGTRTEWANHNIGVYWTTNFCRQLQFSNSSIISKNYNPFNRFNGCAVRPVQ